MRIKLQSHTRRENRTRIWFSGLDLTRRNTYSGEAKQQKRHYQEYYEAGFSAGLAVLTIGVAWADASHRAWDL